MENDGTYGQIEVVKYLITKGINSDDIKTDNIEALAMASNNGYLQMVKFLIENYGYIRPQISLTGLPELQKLYNERAGGIEKRIQELYKTAQHFPENSSARTTIEQTIVGLKKQIGLL